MCNKAKLAELLMRKGGDPSARVTVARKGAISAAPHPRHTDARTPEGGMSDLGRK